MTSAAAEALAAEAGPFDPPIVAARADAEALDRRFDERQLELLGIVEDETAGRGDVTDHPRPPLAAPAGGRDRAGRCLADLQALSRRVVARW